MYVRYESASQECASSPEGDGWSALAGCGSGSGSDDNAPADHTGHANIGPVQGQVRRYVYQPSTGDEKLAVQVEQCPESVRPAPHPPRPHSTQCTHPSPLKHALVCLNVVCPHSLHAVPTQLYMHKCT